MITDTEMVVLKLQKQSLNDVLNTLLLPPPQVIVLTQYSLASMCHSAADIPTEDTSIIREEIMVTRMPMMIDQVSKLKIY